MLFILPAATSDTFLYSKSSGLSASICGRSESIPLRCVHIAAAAGTPIVALFGPTDPARNGPWSAGDVTVRRRPLCSPCHRHRCSLHEGVMHAIPPEEVLKAIDRRLDAVASPATDVAV